jgi:hypothetical protein
VRELTGQLPRWRAWWLLFGRPSVLVVVAPLLLFGVVSPPRFGLGWLAGLAGLAAVLTWSGVELATRGRRIGRRRRPELARLVAETAAAVGAPPPHRIALVTEPVVAARVGLGRSRLVIGAALADRLSADELRALVAHELSVLARPRLEIVLYGWWVRSVTAADPGRHAARVLRELDEFAAAVEQYADHAAGHLTEPATAARAVARAWLIATAEQMPVRSVEWSPSLALRLSRRHPDLTEALLSLVGTRLSTARPQPAPVPA